MTAEQQRLDAARNLATPWKKWGPYLSERQWGTVREDYSANGNAWDYFSHDHARSRAYLWGEDGLAGFSDDQQRLCFALALWNGQDPILKERLFGLVNREGNHGEDVKEYYFYLDSTPTHSYMKYLYKYPHAAYPYDQVVETNRVRSRFEPEYELLDTGVFDDSRYFDVFVEYVKESPEDILIQISVYNRGSVPADLDILPTLWFRNRWSGNPTSARPKLEGMLGAPLAVRAQDSDLGTRFLYCEGDAMLLFTENETNTQRLVGVPNQFQFVKDGINDYVVHGRRDAVNPQRHGTKMAAHYKLRVLPDVLSVVRLRLTPVAPDSLNRSYHSGLFGKNFDDVVKTRRQEADEFYGRVIPPSLSPDEAQVMRQALAGMLWSKQFYYFNLKRWLKDHGSELFSPSRNALVRNEHWHHMYNADIISMPDKWEYPWYAAWDLAFHILPLTMVDRDFGKEQLALLLSENYIHPNGQLPAYEWAFDDVNPPVHAWATIFTYQIEKIQTGRGDVEWLERCFQKLLLNFTWWLNRKDREGKNTFEGGFLGLDNIGVFDRSKPLPTGGYLEQADGTAWVALFSLNMLEISGELAMHHATYADMARKFVQHFVSIAAATVQAGTETGMWDEEDGFFYDVLKLPNGQAQRLKIRSMVGLLPLCAVTVFEGELRERYPEFETQLARYFEDRPELLQCIHDPRKTGHGGRRLGAILDETKLRRVLARMLDEHEFLSPYGLRALSRHHADHPFVFHVDGEEHRVAYAPGESDSPVFGGNSNWRGPIWMPVNALIIRALLQYYAYYGDDFRIECPTGSGHQMTLYEVAEELTRRLTSIFLCDAAGRRPANGGERIFGDDPHWRDCVQFFEYFHGDSGAGLGANHQTGWTGLIARAMHLFATLTPQQILETGKKVGFEKVPDSVYAARA